MNKVTLKELFNIPNCLCYLRILLVPVFLFQYFNASTESDYLIAACILIVSGLTDFLDGFIARRFHMITDFGKFIDPLADKLTQFTVAFVLLYTYSYMWILAVVIVIKDVMIATLSLYLYEKGEKIRGASWWGKVSTAFFYVVVIGLIGMNVPDSTLSTGLILMMTFFMTVSLVLYAKVLTGMVKEQKRNG